MSKRAYDTLVVSLTVDKEGMQRLQELPAILPQLPDDERDRFFDIVDEALERGDLFHVLFRVNSEVRISGGAARARISFEPGEAILRCFAALEERRR